MAELFEQSSRAQDRWGTGRGVVSVEELWQMPLKDDGKEAFSLNSIAQQLSGVIRANKEENFVDEIAKSDEALERKFAIVKHIIKVKLAENKASQEEAATKEKKQQYLSLIADKQNTELANKPIEELIKEYEAL